MSTLISQLPEEIRKKAEERREEYQPGSEVDLLYKAFAWIKSAEGYEYWDYIDVHRCERKTVRERIENVVDKRLSRNETIDLLVKLWEEGKL